jgi:flagellar biosynthetic protein FliR
MLGFGLSIEPQLWALVFVMIRIGATFIAAPVFGSVSVPLTVRVTLSGAIGFLVLAAHPIVPPQNIFAVTTMLSAAAEALVGLALGFVLQIAFAAPMIAAEVIGGAMGLGFASSIDPQNGKSSPALGQFFSIMLTLLFLSVDGHLILIAWIGVERLKAIAFFGGYAFLAGLLLALPVGFLLLCLNIVVGMLSRAAPSLNLFAVGLPASLAVGVVTLAIAFPTMGDYMLVVVREGLSATETLVLG